MPERECGVPEMILESATNGFYCQCPGTNRWPLAMARHLLIAAGRNALSLDEFANTPQQKGSGN